MITFCTSHKEGEGGSTTQRRERPEKGEGGEGKGRSTTTHKTKQHHPGTERAQKGHLLRKRGWPREGGKHHHPKGGGGAKQEAQSGPCFLWLFFGCESSPATKGRVCCCFSFLGGAAFSSLLLFPGWCCFQAPIRLVGGAAATSF